MKHDNDSSAAATVSKQPVGWATLHLLVLGLGVSTLIVIHEARALADHSAHAALAQEICDQLAATPPGKSYPPSLSQLHLNCRDAGNARLLRRFSYRPNGTNCTVRTRLDGAEFVRSFP